MGPEHMRKYIVTTGHYAFPHGLLWDDERAIEIANRKYEAGTHELCQGRDGDFIIQYCIPRKRPVKRRPFAWAGPLADRAVRELAFA